MDKDKTGKLTFDELKDALYGDHAMYYDEKEIIKILKDADINGDNKISYKELITNMYK